MSPTSGGASASNRGKDLRGDAAQARAARQAGERVKRGQSETAFKRQAKAWDAGALGEERAARHLERLRREGFTILHDVLLEPPKPWNLDHMVVGPAGVFFVDAKNWRGHITVFRGGLWRDWYGGPKTGRQSENMAKEVAKVKGMAARASQRLGVWVTPVICLTGAKSRQFEGVADVDGVRVVSVDAIVAWLRDARAALSSDEVKMWAEIAQRIFPAAVKESQNTSQDQERARWAEAMRSGGAPQVKAAPPMPPAATAPSQRPAASPAPKPPRRLFGR